VLIAQVANFYGPQSGGLRTTLDQLGRGYIAAGHERLLIVPGARDDDRSGVHGRVITVASPALGATGYRVMPNWRKVAAIVERAGADRLEVSDKATLRPLGRWAADRGIPAVLISHERLDAILATRAPRAVPLIPLADRWNRRLVDAFAKVVCTSAFSRAEWERIAAPDVRTVALGVDLLTFRPGPRRRPLSPDAIAQLVCVGRLSREKRPELAIDALAELIGVGVAAHLTMVGAGPMHAELLRRAARLPVTFTGHVADRGAVAQFLRAADVAIAPCPAETFGLSVLEALACGTPVVAADRGAAGELLTPACGVTAAPRPIALATGVAKVLALPPVTTRVAARRRAEQFPWSATVAAMLAVHDLAAAPAGRERAA
jgi:alpha-1,6-mannosyltransferase